MTRTEIESLTRDYAEVRRLLAEQVDELQTELEGARRRHLPGIKVAVAQAAGAHAKLAAALAAAPELFEKPRSLIIEGIRVGFQKQKGKVEFEDEGAVIDRIRRLLPTPQAELLIRTRESVDKNAVYDLTAADLKRLGIRITDDEDAVLIKPVDSEVDRLVTALLQDAEQIEEEAG